MNKYCIYMFVACCALPSCLENEIGIVNDGLVAWYPLDGDGKDYSGNKLHGTVLGAQFTADRFGKQGGACLVSDSTNVLLGDILDDIFCESVAQWSVSGWARPQKSGTLHYGAQIIGKSTGRAGTIQWTIGYNNYDVAFGIYSDKDAFNYKTQYIHAEVFKWFHFVMIFDGSLPAEDRIKVYVNANPEISRFVERGTLGTSTENTSQELNIGGHRISPESKVEHPFNGAIDDIRIYNRAISNQEVMELYFSENMSLN